MHVYVKIDVELYSSCCKVATKVYKSTLPIDLSMISKNEQGSGQKTQTHVYEVTRKEVTTIGNGKLSELIGRAEVAPSSGKGNYHKKAIPFDLDNPIDVGRIEAICAVFNDPWSTGREYSRSHLAADLGDFCKKVEAGELEVISAEEFNQYIAPIRALAEKAQAEADVKAEAEKAEGMTYDEMSNKQLRACLKTRGLSTKGNKANLQARLTADDEPEEEEEPEAPASEDDTEEPQEE